MEVFDYDIVITHSTVFHADDVFGVAMCRLIDPDIRIIRTLDVEGNLEAAKQLNKKVLVFDIGMGKYDHHQEGKTVRADGTPYCGFGLLWRDFGYLLCPDREAWERVDQTVVLPIDKADNGIQQNLLSMSVKAFNPNWNDVTSENVAFHRTMIVAAQILKAHIDHANAAVAAKSEVVANYTGGHILVLDKYLPWMDAVHTDERLKDVLFAVYPSQRGGWNVQTVSKEPGQFVNRMDFPKEWLGHADPDRGIHFAHTSNFLIACNTKEQAVKVAEEAIEAGKSEYSVAYSI